MTANLETALSRLRNADPAATTPLDAQGKDPHTQAMLTKILRASGDHAVATPNRTPAVRAVWRLPERSSRRWR